MDRDRRAVGRPRPQGEQGRARVAIYAWKNPDQLAAAIRERKVHRDPELYALPAELLDGVAATLDRTNKWDLAVTGGQLYLTVGDRLFEGSVTRVAI